MRNHQMGFKLHLPALLTHECHLDESYRKKPRVSETNFRHKPWA